jgi:hypothetical protein
VRLIAAFLLLALTEIACAACVLVSLLHIIGIRMTTADWQWLARGYVTITVLDADSDAGPASRDLVSARLSVIEKAF